MSLIDTIKNTLVPIHREGYIFIGIALAVTILFGLLGIGFLVWVGLIITAWICYFFRDPKRTTPSRPGLVISPADGRVSDVRDVIPPAELELSAEPMTRVSVFMNVFDCHVNRAPLAGRIEAIKYRPGKFLNADLDKASEDNERNSLILSHNDTRIGVVQIAGLVARRIVCFSQEGDDLEAGERFGLIRFGSRLDVYLPKGSTVLVSPGQRAVAGETCLADLLAKKGDGLVFNRD